MRALPVLLVLAALVLAGCAGKPEDQGPGAPAPGTQGEANEANCTAAPKLPCAVMETSNGTIVLQLYADKAPLSVANFLQDAQDRLYDGTVFHRVAANPAVIQGGGYASPFHATDRPRASPNGPIPVEAWAGNGHEIGTLGMARTNDPNSGTNQWFINTAANRFLDPKLNPQSSQDVGYTVFGRVTQGLDVVTAISKVALNGSAPREDVVIRTVRVATADGAPTPALKAFHASLDVAPGGEVSTPLLVRNAGGGRLSVEMRGNGTQGLEVDFPHTPGPLSDGQTGVAILRVKAPSGFTGGAVEVIASGPGGNATAHLDLKPLAATGNAAGPEHGAVKALYLGLYDNGVVFDTTLTGLAEQGFAMPVGFGEHPQPFQAWVGPESATPPPGYSPVIPGFASGIVGLHAGETRTVRLSSEEGYRDGFYRVFEMTVKSVDS